MVNRIRRVTSSILVTGRIFRVSGAKHQSQRRPDNGLGALFCAALLAGCQGPSMLAVNEHLDTASGVTLLSADKAIVFARTESRYSRSARDYIYLGPVETNRQGKRDYYLWVGIATTLDRGFVAPLVSLPETLILDVHGELMELGQWPERVPGLQRVEMYKPTVAIQAELVARVTLYQLDLLAAERLDSIRVTDGEGRTRRYSRWDDQAAWPGFLSAVAASNQTPR